MVWYGMVWYGVQSRISHWVQSRHQTLSRTRPARGRTRKVPARQMCVSPRTPKDGARHLSPPRVGMTCAIPRKEKKRKGMTWNISESGTPRDPEKKSENPKDRDPSVVRRATAVRGHRTVVGCLRPVDRGPSTTTRVTSHHHPPGTRCGPHGASVY